MFFKVDHVIYNEELLKFYFNKFWKIVSPKINEGCHNFVLLKFRFKDGHTHSIFKLFRLNENNHQTYIPRIADFMESMADYYNKSPIDMIIFNYGFKSGEIIEDLNKSEIDLMNFRDMKFPISINPEDYGKILNKTSFSEGNIYTIIDNFGRVIIFKNLEKENLISYFKNQNLILEFKDVKISENRFMRIIGKRTLFFENGNTALELLKLAPLFIEKMKLEKKRN